MEEKKLQELIDWTIFYQNGYRDPDGINSNKNDIYKYFYKNEDFYRIHLKVLNHSEKFEVLFDVDGDEYDMAYKKPGLKFKRRGKDTKTYYLKSDQFGFSSPGAKKGKLVYPYELYLKKVLEKNESYLPEAKEKVREWMRITRQVGGSFFWPMEFKDGKYEDSMYNKARGGSKYGGKRYYIQDRVDLTLFEIYEYYKFKEGKSIDKGNILIENAKSSNEMKSWLNEFNDFEEYINFFKLNSFVHIKKDGKYIPYNLLDDKEDTPFDEVVEREPGIIDAEMTIKKYERLFSRIAKKIKERRKELGIKED